MNLDQCCVQVGSHVAEIGLNDKLLDCNAQPAACSPLRRTPGGSVSPLHSKARLSASAVYEGGNSRTRRSRAATVSFSFLRDFARSLRRAFRRRISFPNELVDSSSMLRIHLKYLILVPQLISTPNRARKKYRSSVKRVPPRWPLKWDKAIAHLVSIYPSTKAQFVVKADPWLARA